MLQLYDKDHNKVEGLIRYEDYKIESVLESCDKTLSFLYPKVAAENIELEGYIQNKTDEFVIKEISNHDEDYISVLTKMNVEALEGKEWDRFDTTEQTIKDSLSLACAGTGWTVNLINNITKKRTVRKTSCSSWDIIQEIKDIYRIELIFDSLNKVIKVYEKIGQDKGVYFMDSLNLISLDYNNDTNEYYTRIRAEGKDGLKLDGKGYLENYQYSNKIKTFYWKDERYTILEDLKEDAAAKLEELSKPKKSYRCDIQDLAKINKKEYSILDFNLGDIITLISKKDRFRDKQRIVKTIEYPDEPEKNECELSNTMASFEDIKKEEKQVYDTLDNITSDDGTIAESAIKDVVKHIVIDKADINSLNAVSARVGTLEATSATINDLKVFKADVNKLAATKANITDLNASNAKIGVLESSTALINNLLAGNITADMTQTIHLTGKNVVIDEGIIKSAMIESLDVGKINAGVISTNKFQIKSSTGGIEIVGETQQWRDEKGKVRMIAGRDANNKFTFGVFDETGQGTLIDSTGVKEKALANGIIKDRMINSNEISGSKINIDSLITSINSNTSNTIKSTKVYLNESDQTLDVAFKKVTSNVSSIKESTTALQTEIKLQQGKIESLIKNTTISSNGTTVNLKDDYVSLKSTVNGINSTVSSVNSSISSLNSKVSSHDTSIKQLNNSIKLKVSSSDVINSIKEINLNSPNYIKNGCFLNGYDNWNEALENNSTKSIIDSTSGYKKAFRIVTNSNNQNIMQTTEALPSNSTYTASTYCFVQEGVASLVIKVQDHEGKYKNYEVKSSGLGWQWLELTFETEVTKPVSLYLGNWQNGNLSYGTYQFTAVSIVKGKYRNDWQESSTYVNTSLSNLNVEKNKITARVSSVETTTTAINKNVSSLTTRMSSAEQSITPTSIIAKVTSGITGGSPISTTAWKLEKNNFSIYNGALNVYNSKNIKVFYVDTYGNASARGNFYNYDSNNVLRASITNKKLNLYNESGSYIGGLGSNQYAGNTSIKGLTMDLDMAGKYISFAIRQSSSSSTYNTVFSYHRAGSFDTEGLNGYANFNMHGYSITNSGNLIESTHIKAMEWISSDGSGGTNYIRVVVNRTSNQFLRGITTWASDVRLKFNIKDTERSGLEEISRFKHRQFNWRENGKHQEIGYIAQELEKINPDYVLKIKQLNGDYLYQIKPEMIIPVLSKAIQELKEENNILKERIDKICGGV